jgi:uncharacterized BrkB/YihY/UPF0761 family membrane protein
MFSILYYASPNVRQPGFRWVTPGGALAVILWLIASAAFALFVEAGHPADREPFLPPRTEPR